MRRRDKGAALIVAMVVVVVVGGLAAALMNSASERSRSADDRLEAYQAFEAAQAAVDRAIARIATVGPASASFGSQFITDERMGDLTPITDDGGQGILIDGSDEPVEVGVAEYFAVVGDAGNGKYAVVGAARLGGAERVLEVIVKPPASDSLPGPFPPSGAGSHGAMGIFGDAANIDFKSGNHASVSISGMDQSVQNEDVLGLAGDAHTYNLIEAEVNAGALDPEVFGGTPMNTLDYGGTDVQGSIGEVSDARVDGDTMLAYAEAIKDTVNNTLIPAADRTISGGTVQIRNPETWGTVASPEIVVVDASKLMIKDHVSGAGTLVVLGDFDLHKDSFTWDGDVIILGSSGDAGIHNVGGTMNITGTIVAIADGNQTHFHVNNPSAVTNIDGALLMMGGDATPGGGLTHFHVNSNGAAFNMSGMMMLMGDNTYLHMSPHTTIDMDGDIAVAVQASASPDVKVWLQADIDIQHDSVAVDNALGLLEDFFDEYAPDVPPPAGSGTYDILVWREK